MHPATGDHGFVDRLRSDLTRAIGTRDRAAVSALRSALAAIDNAGAVEAVDLSGSASGPIAGAATGLGASEVPRRKLSPAELEELIRAEIAHRDDAAAEYERAGRRDRAVRLLEEAAILGRYLDGG